jgi:hypothetical protein
VMAGAKGESGFDFDCDRVGCQARTTMAPMHKKAPARTGFRPARELATQSRLSVRPKVAQRAVASPEAAATSAGSPYSICPKAVPERRWSTSRRFASAVASCTTTGRRRRLGHHP